MFIKKNEITMDSGYCKKNYVSLAKKIPRVTCVYQPRAPSKKNLRKKRRLAGLSTICTFFTLCLITYRNDTWISRSYFVSLRNRLTLHELCSRKIEAHTIIYENTELIVWEFSLFSESWYHKVWHYSPYTGFLKRIN